MAVPFGVAVLGSKRRKARQWARSGVGLGRGRVTGAAKKNLSAVQRKEKTGDFGPRFLKSSPSGTVFVPILCFSFSHLCRGQPILFVPLLSADSAVIGCMVCLGLFVRSIALRAGRESLGLADLKYASVPIAERFRSFSNHRLKE